MKKVLLFSISLILFSASHAQRISQGAGTAHKRSAGLAVDSARTAMMTTDSTVKKRSPKKPNSQVFPKPVDSLRVRRRN